MVSICARIGGALHFGPCVTFYVVHMVSCIGLEHTIVQTNLGFKDKRFFVQEDNTERKRRFGRGIGTMKRSS